MSAENARLEIVGLRSQQQLNRRKGLVSWRLPLLNLAPCPASSPQLMFGHIGMCLIEEACPLLFASTDWLPTVFFAAQALAPCQARRVFRIQC